MLTGLTFTLRRDEAADFANRSAQFKGCLSSGRGRKSLSQLGATADITSGALPRRFLVLGYSLEAVCFVVPDNLNLPHLTKPPRRFGCGTAASNLFLFLTTVSSPRIDYKMPPKNKMTTKVCPDCDTPCAVACKTCTCGYSFYQARRSDGASASASTSSAGADQAEQDGVRQRRTQRIKEKPNYYDATEFMKEKRKRRRRNDDQYELRRGNEPATSSGALKRRKKRKGRGAAKEEEEEEEVVLPIGTAPEKMAQCAVILADLNRRIQSTAVRVR